MNKPQFSSFISLSNQEIADEIVTTEKIIFDLRFKKATRKPFKLHELRTKKRYLAQLKTLLSVRLEKKN